MKPRGPLALPPLPPSRQAAALEGVWELRDPEADQRRVDGSLVDGVIRAALVGAAGGGAGGEPPKARLPTKADLVRLIEEALADSSSVTSYVLVVPHVDAKTGLFAAYRLIQNGTFR